MHSMVEIIFQNPVCVAKFAIVINAIQPTASWSGAATASCGHLLAIC